LETEKYTFKDALLWLVWPLACGPPNTASYCSRAASCQHGRMTSVPPPMRRSASTVHLLSCRTRKMTQTRNTTCQQHVADAGPATAVPSAHALASRAQVFLHGLLHLPPPTSQACHAGRLRARPIQSGSTWRASSVHASS
jgi:hypothetical protein